MNGVDVGNLGRGDYCRNVQIAVGRARRTNADGLIGKTNVQGVAVRFAIHSDGTHAEFTACIEDAQSNFATIGDQNLTKHSTPSEAEPAISRVSGASKNPPVADGANSASSAYPATPDGW
jgi:hypothetical protein